MITTVRIVENGPGYSIEDTNTGHRLVDNRVFDSYGMAKGFAYGQWWYVDESRFGATRQDIIL